MTAVVLLVLTAPLMILTAVGSRRRGCGVGVSILAGVFFPFAWTQWYLRDERPYRSSTHL